MIALEHMVPDLLGLTPLVAGGEADGIAVGVVELALDLPIESWIAANGDLWVCAPRGRLATGFDAQHGRLRARFVREEP